MTFSCQFMAEVYDGVWSGTRLQQPTLICISISVVYYWFRAQSFDLRTMGFSFQGAPLCGFGNARRHTFRRPVVKAVDLCAKLLYTEGFVTVLAAFLLRSNHHT